MFVVIVRVDGAVPDEGVTEIQGALDVAVQLSVPPPVFVMFTVCAAGFVPPAVELNVRLAADIVIVAGAGGGGGGGGGGADGASDPPPHADARTSAAAVR